MKHSYSNDDTCFSIDVIDEILEEDFDALLDDGSEILHFIKGTILKEKLFAEFDEFMAMTADENFVSESDTEEAPFEKKLPLTQITKSKHLLKNLLWILNSNLFLITWNMKEDTAYQHLDFTRKRAFSIPDTAFNPRPPPSDHLRSSSPAGFRPPPSPENFSGGLFRQRPKSLPITGSIQPPYPLALTRAAATRTTTTAATTVTPPPSQPRTTKGAAVCYKYPRECVCSWVAATKREGCHRLGRKGALVCGLTEKVCRVCLLVWVGLAAGTAGGQGLSGLAVETAGGNPQYALQDQGIFDSRCSRHMTGNKSFLIDYQEVDGGFVAFAGSPKGGKITGKVKLGLGN
ncbi:hypothetical protein Tco_1003938 [Tanacetum coccineum]|uniref:Uncharacterized protein n=1 Tax=Tanacetum coccineum TaxID=301880 RepID=A0ABQ5FBU2_9ASTR